MLYLQFAGVISDICMILGFMLAAYSVIANDSLQTLGTFLYSNSGRPWWHLCLFASSILAITLVGGWFLHSGDAAWGRLAKYPEREVFNWVFVVPPFVLLLITRMGIPVSTSFLILTFFSWKNFESMLIKSAGGYLLAMLVGFVAYSLALHACEKVWNREEDKDEPPRKWVVLQWTATGGLWSVWLAQDMANIFVYLPRNLPFIGLLLALGWLILIQVFIFREGGGKIQKVVKSKTNLNDIRSATVVDFIYAILLIYKLTISTIPMSTTWVFIGLLAGRELGLSTRGALSFKGAFKKARKDFVKVFFGLGVAVGVAVLLRPYVPASEASQTLEGDRDIPVDFSVLAPALQSK